MFIISAISSIPKYIEVCDFYDFVIGGLWLHLSVNRELGLGLCCGLLKGL